MKMAVNRMKVRLYISWLITSEIMGHLSSVHTYLPVPSLQLAYKINSRTTEITKEQVMVRLRREIEMTPFSITNHFSKKEESSLTFFFSC